MILISIGKLPQAQVVDITLSKGRLPAYIARNSLSRWIGDQNNYYTIYLDEECKGSQIHQDILASIASRGDTHVQEIIIRKEEGKPEESEDTSPFVNF
jgi:hypothetical protein